MEQRSLGRSDPRVGALGLGLMGMSGMYGPSDEAESIATVHAALDAGVTLLDTGDFYGMGHNEMLLGRALAGRRREDVVISVKFGAQRDPSGTWIGYDARPAAVKTALAYSLTRLGTDYVDIYRPARVDPAVPIEETIGAIGELVQAGFVRHVGLSEVGPDTLRRAATVLPIADVQIEYSLVSRTPERGLLAAARELGTAVTAYGVLSRGLLSGHWAAGQETTPGDFRAHSPRFQGENLRRNLELVEALRVVAERRGATVAQVAVAWVLARGGDVVPVIGARRRDRLAESLAAVELRLSREDLVAIEAAVPEDAVSGERYPAAQMAMLDSEPR